MSTGEPKITDRHASVSVEVASIWAADDGLRQAGRRGTSMALSRLTASAFAIARGLPEPLSQRDA